MTRRYAMAVDTVRCVGCAGCVIACKTENAVPNGGFRDWIVQEASARTAPRPLAALHPRLGRPGLRGGANPYVGAVLACTGSGFAAGELEAAACRRCGYVELYLKDPSTIPIDGENVREESVVPALRASL